MTQTLFVRSIAVLLMLLGSNAALGAGPDELAFSTCFGGGAGETIRDVEVDSPGNVYVRGRPGRRISPQRLGPMTGVL